MGLNEDLARLAAQAQITNERTKTFRGELYGPSGGGKSTIAAMMMRNLVDIRTGDRILNVDTSEGYVSWGNHPGLADGIITIPFTSIDDLRSIARGIKHKIAPWDKIKGVILDEGSKMAQIDAIKVNRNRQQGAYGEKMQASANVISEGPDYMIALERWREMLFELFDNRDIHVIVTAHESDKKDRQGNIIGVFPQFSPKVNAATKEYLHLVAHLVGTVSTDLATNSPVYRRVAQVHPTMMVEAKCRLNITDISVNADSLPNLVHDWLKAGGDVQEAPDERGEEVVGVGETVTSGIDGILNDPGESAIVDDEPTNSGLPGQDAVDIIDLASL